MASFRCAPTLTLAPPGSLSAGASSANRPRTATIPANPGFPGELTTTWPKGQRESWRRKKGPGARFNPCVCGATPAVRSAALSEKWDCRLPSLRAPSEALEGREIRRQQSPRMPTEKLASPIVLQCNCTPESRCTAIEFAGHNARMWWHLRLRLWCRRSVDPSEVRVVVGFPERPDSLDSHTVATGFAAELASTSSEGLHVTMARTEPFDGAVFPAGV